MAASLSGLAVSSGAVSGRAGTDLQVRLPSLRADEGVPAWSVHAVIYSTILLNFVLCVLRTRGLPVGSNAVAACELATYAAALYWARREVPLGAIGVAVGTVLYVLSMRTFVNPEIEPRILRDLAIPFVFVAFGRTCGDPEQADRVVYWAVAIVTAGALFEAFLPESYSKLVDILTFYYERGGPTGVTFDQVAKADVGNTLYMGATRIADEGRTVGSFLGDLIGNHRVSSVFLEAVSSSAFSGIAFGWMVSRFSSKPMINIVFLCLATLNILLADGRMASVTCLTALAIYLFRLSLNGIAIFCLPFAALLFLVLDGAYSNGIMDNGLSGRLLMSGSVLYSWGVDEWLALKSSALTVVDCGYGWLLSNIGLIPLAAFWSLFAFQGRLALQQRQWLTLMALYFVLSLCVGPASLSVKTAGLAWFLCGVMTSPRWQAT
jgi:putative polymerase